MLFFDKFRSDRRPLLGATVLVGLAAGASWASVSSTVKPCPRASVKSGGVTVAASALAELANSAKEPGRREESTAGFCLGHFTKNLARSLAADQKEIWTAPLRRQAWYEPDQNWLIPVALGTTALGIADRDIMQRFASAPRQHANSFSNYGVAAMIGGSAALYFRGTATGNRHKSETGLLAAEATVNGFLVGEAVKTVSRRPRPGAPDAGIFGSGGASFPSEHALAAWSIASVVAHEYPGPLTKILAYGGAAGISLARVGARQHFPSDVVVGGVLGYLIGQYTYRARHDPELPGASARNAGWDLEPEPSRARRPAQLGSPSVPLDSWVYATFDRLAALGYAPSAYANLRPWTRMECARIIAAAGADLRIDLASSNDPQVNRPAERMRRADPGASGASAREAYRLQAALGEEFASELLRLDGAGSSGIGVDSLYTRYLGIGGTPLDDGYHFGQTILNDFGRLYGPGSNLVSGLSASGSAGPVAFYFRGEYQHAAPLPAYSPAVQQMLGAIDVTPPQLPIHTGIVDRFRFLDAYASWNFKTIQVSAGRQSLWWGPSHGGPPNLSDNAPPMDMLRLSNPSPWRLPGFFHWLGPMRWDFFFGLMSGHHFPAGPAVDGQKLSFKPTPNLEFGFSRTIVFRPVTLGMLWRGFASFGDHKSTIPGSAADVGDRRGGFDFSYRIPGLRNWLVLYNDGMTDDDTSPLGAPQRSLMNPGIYLPQIPRVPKLDLRAEMAWSDPPSLSNWRGRYVYYNGAYHDSYTNDGHLLGSWVGREGHGLQLWSTYWLSPRKSVQAGYRRAHVDRDFIPSGGDIQDFSLRSTWRVSPEIEINTFLQYERWNFPVLSPMAGPNTTASIELIYHPNWHKTLSF